MVLGEFKEDVIEKMASSDELTDFYIKLLKDAGIDESDKVIVNLALGYLIDELDNDASNMYKVCKECLVVEYLNLHGGKVDFEDADKEDDVLTLNQILNNANSN